MFKEQDKLSDTMVNNKQRSIQCTFNGSAIATLRCNRSIVGNNDYKYYILWESYGLCDTEIENKNN